MNNQKKAFFDIVMARSNENAKALEMLIEIKCYALIGAILRMELDSLIRVHYFNNTDDEMQKTMLKNFFNNKKWTPTDRDMVKILSNSLGWAKHIYDFCCAFIHLSPYHDWATTPNIPNLTIDKRCQIVTEIRQQQNDTWGYDTTLVIKEDFSFNELIPFVPHIFKKLRSNLEYETNQFNTN